MMAGANSTYSSNESMSFSATQAVNGLVMLTNNSEMANDLPISTMPTINQTLRSRLSVDVQFDGANSTSTTSIGSNNSSVFGNNSLVATLSSIRKNVTRVLHMYFQNVSDEFEYGATSTSTRTTTIRTSPAPPPVTLSPTESVTTTKTTIATTTTRAISRMVNDVLTAAPSTFPAHFTNQTNAQTTERTTSPTLTTAPSITYPSYSMAVRSQENCSTLFTNYTLPEEGTFCNWTWDGFLCWPPTPSGVLARMNCPSGWHGIDTKKFANRKCEWEGHWGGRPNETYNPNGWTDYQPCFKPEVNELMQQMKNIDLYLDIARRTRTLEIVGLILSLFALVLSLIIFCNFRSLRNNRTKIHKNLFIAMVLQVIVRLTLYLDQAFRRGKQQTATTVGLQGIENTPYLCEGSYVLLEYARTAMFMWMFIEGLYLHNMVTVAVFQGRFPHTIFSTIGWGMPVLMTTVWALATAAYTDSEHDCWWNYNLTPYYWILEGPRLIVILLNFFFLMNIIRVLVVKLRQSQASDIEQTRKAVRAAIVLLPLLGITNLLHLVPDLHTPWKFALWSYVTHFLTSFQGFFIALIYCFLNGEVRAVLLKSLAVYMSLRGHPEWVPKRASMFSGAYNTAPDTEGQQDTKRIDTPPNPRLINGQKLSSPAVLKTRTTHITTPNLLSPGGDRQQQQWQQRHEDDNNTRSRRRSNSWLIALCFRGQKNKCVMPSKNMPLQIFMTTKFNQNTCISANQKPHPPNLNNQLRANAIANPNPSEIA